MSRVNVSKLVNQGQVVETADLYSLLNYDGQGINDVLDNAKVLSNYAALRSYGGRAKTVRISQAGIAGLFYLDANDTTSQDNGGTIIVTVLGKRWKRIYEGAIFVSWFDIKFDGKDESFKFQAAIDLASMISVKNQISDDAPVCTKVNFDTGKVYNGSVILKKGVSLNFNGSTIRLPNGTNKTVIEGENYQSLTGTNSGLGVWNWEVRDVVIDGNKLNNNTPNPKAGHGLAVYGRNFLVENVKDINCFRRGQTVEYGTGAVGTSPFNGKIKKVVSNKAGEHGIYVDVSDTHVDDVNVRSSSQSSHNTYDGFICNKGVRATNINVWRGGDTTITHRYSANLSDGCTVSNLHLETAGTSNLRMVGDRSKVNNCLSYNLLGNNHALVSGSGHFLSMTVHNGGVSGENLGAIGVRLGDTAPVAYCNIEVSGINVSGGVVNFVNDIGGNNVKGSVYLNSDNDILFLGTPHISDDVNIIGTGAGSLNKSFKKLSARNGSITGVGNTQEMAAMLVATVNRVFANNTSLNAFVLPKANGGDIKYVANISNVSIQIYPFKGDSFLGLAVDSPITLAVGESKQIVSHSNSQWALY